MRIKIRVKNYILCSYFWWNFRENMRFSQFFSKIFALKVYVLYALAQFRFRFHFVFYKWHHGWHQELSENIYFCPFTIYNSRLYGANRKRHGKLRQKSPEKWHLYSATLKLSPLAMTAKSNYRTQWRIQDLMLEEV